MGYYERTPDVDLVGIDEAKERLWKHEEEELGLGSFALDVEVDDDTIERLMQETWFDDFSGEIVARRDVSGKWFWQLRREG